MRRQLRRRTVITEPVAGQVTLSAGAVPGLVPAIATRAFDGANNIRVGSLVATIERPPVPAKIVAVANAFPTVTGAALM